MLNALRPVTLDGAKPAVQQVWESLHWGARLMATPNDYRTHRMFRSGFTRRDALRFLSGARGKQYIWPLNGEPEILEDKATYEDHFAALGLPVPHTRAVIGDIVETEQRPKLVGRDAVREHLAAALAVGDQVVVKPLDAWEGEGVHVLTGLVGDDEYLLSNGDRMPIAGLLDTVSTGRWLVQDRITQHDDIAALNDSTLNTMRLGTFRRNDGEVQVIFAVLRIGRAYSQIDTYNHGGYSIRIDPATGQFADHAYQKAKFSLDLAAAHADSGAVFAGRRIPFWEEVVRNAKEFAAAAGANRFVGWDVASTPEGPLFVEGNHNWDIQLAQIGSTGLLSDDFTALLRSETGMVLDTDRMPPLRPREAYRQLRRAS